MVDWWLMVAGFVVVDQFILVNSVWFLIVDGGWVYGGWW